MKNWKNSQKGTSVRRREGWDHRPSHHISVYQDMFTFMSSLINAELEWGETELVNSWQPQPQLIIRQLTSFVTLPLWRLLVKAGLVWKKCTVPLVLSLHNPGKYLEKKTNPIQLISLAHHFHMFFEAKILPKGSWNGNANVINQKQCTNQNPNGVFSLIVFLLWTISF